MSAGRRVVPVVVLTGFLGSGKTTLLNRWLGLGGGRAPGGGRLALIVNELGAIGVDGALVPAATTRQIELAGGCVCCQLDEDLARTVAMLVDRDADLELIVVETTGVADPLPIAWTLARPPLDTRIRLAAVVTVVDARNHMSHRDGGHGVDAQVDAADLLALSKLDLVADERASAEVHDHLTRRNPDATLISASQDEVARALWAVLGDPAFESRPRGPHDHGRAPGDGGPDPGHGLEAVGLPIVGTLDFEELTAALEALPSSVVRIKGIARVVDRSTGDDQVRQVAFHRVGARVSSEPVPGDVPARIVAIGRQVDVEALRACLRAAMVS